MAENIKRALRHPAAHLILLSLALALEFLFVRRAISARGLVPELQSTLASAESAWRAGSFPQSAAYPPLIPALIMTLRGAGLPLPDPWLFNLVAAWAGLLVLYALSRRALGAPLPAFAAGLLALANPYALWTFLLSRDAALEFFLGGLMLWAVVSVVRREAEGRRAGSLVWLSLAAAVALGFTRVTGFFAAAAVFLIALVISRSPGLRRGWALALLGLTTSALLLCAFNLRQAGAFRLATNGGYNLYLGNHPAYLHAHPHYDVDVFLGPVAQAEGFEGLPEAERDQAYTRRAIEFIQSDPAAFALRLALKSAWHWFNLEKIPNYTSPSLLQPDGQTALLAPIDVLPGLVYMLYRLFTLPLFVAVLVLMGMRRLERHVYLLIAPLLGLWPVVALTFPDTRFKIDADLLTLPAMVAVWMYWRGRR